MTTLKKDTKDKIRQELRRELLIDTIDDLIETDQKYYSQRKIASILWISETSYGRYLKNWWIIKPITVEKYLKRLNTK